jgi:hypothetical protein
MLVAPVMVKTRHPLDLRDLKNLQACQTRFPVNGNLDTDAFQLTARRQKMLDFYV